MLSQLRALAEKTITDCTHCKAVDFATAPTPLLLPSGDEKYVAFWVRDAAMMAESGLIPSADLRRYVALTATYGQNRAQTRHLAHGLEVPPFAVADHINYNGKPVFFPGTYADGEDQGDGIYGSYPPLDDNYYFIAMAGQYIRQSGDTAILEECFAGLPLAECLRRAFEGYLVRPDTGLCHCAYHRFAADWGFTDSVAMHGDLLFASLLRYRAARVMQTLFPAQSYDAVAETLAMHIIQSFYDAQTGWFWSSTGADRQHDVWGTAYAVYLRIAGEADDHIHRQAAQALAQAYRDGTSGVHGYIRHILTTEDARPGESAWARCSAPVDTYQNGTYWATPLGWYAVAVHLIDPSLSRTMLEEFLAHTQTYAATGAPFEWISRETDRFSGCLYGTSGVLPYVGALRILQESEK